jgi:UDP-N-acetylmuramoyl-L-alanyl-D-glutamate--2,6-diaminopimelate ligase
MITVHDLLAAVGVELPAALAAAAASVRVRGLTLDSRAVQPGDLFLALPGRRSHGLEHAAEAAARGARAILFDPPVGAAGGPAAAAGAGAVGGTGAAGDAGRALPAEVLLAPVPGLARLVGRIADRFFEHPSERLRVAGITGTNGKTTCAWLLAQCLERVGLGAGYLGTLGWGRLGEISQVSHTTPDAVQVHRMLAELGLMGARCVAMEVSSHALDQGRVDGVRFRIAAFTNLTRDHLDYHGSMEAYGEAKALLFAGQIEHAVINVGDAFGRHLAARCATPLIAVSVGAQEFVAAGLFDTLIARRVQVDLRGLVLEVEGSLGRVELRTRLLGRFNAENALIVLGCLHALGIPLEAGARALEGCEAAPGRMELLESPDPGRPLAVIDYAHTPDALAKALQALREHCAGDLWCVFGCGGDRDRGKRPLMGAIADELADRLIVTDDNPRGESPAAIVEEIIAGFRVHAPRVIHDRARAIGTALSEARSGDWVLIAGKGHEDYQIYGSTRRRFSDRHEALKSLGVAA